MLAFTTRLGQVQKRASLEVLEAVDMLFTDMDMVDALIKSCQGLRKLQLSGVAKAMPSIDALCQHRETLQILLVDISMRHPSMPRESYASVQHHMYHSRDVNTSLYECVKLQELGLAMCVASANAPGGYFLVGYDARPDQNGLN